MAVNEPDIVRLAVEGTYQGQLWVNVFHFHKADNTAVTASDLNSLAAILDDAATDNDALAHLYTQMDAGLLTTRMVLTSLGSGGNVPVQKEQSITISGLSAGGSDAQAMLSIVVKWGTGIASRRSRGRTFLSGINTSMQGTDPDYVGTTTSSAIGLAAQQWADAWAANTTWEFGVFSHVVDGAVETTQFAEIINASVNPVFAVQRRRRPRTSG